MTLRECRENPMMVSILSLIDDDHFEMSRQMVSLATLSLTSDNDRTNHNRLNWLIFPHFEKFSTLSDFYTMSLNDGIDCFLRSVAFI